MTVRLDLWVPPTPEIEARMRAMSNEALEELGEVMVDMVQQRGAWPRDTGLSARRLKSRRVGRTVQFVNNAARRGRPYAVWVERRWFPLEKFFTAARMRRAIAAVERTMRLRGPGLTAGDINIGRQRTRRRLADPTPGIAAVAGAAALLPEAGGVAALFADSGSAASIAGQLALFRWAFDSFGAEYDDLRGKDLGRDPGDG